PDYVPVRTRSRPALVLGLALLGVWAAGAALVAWEWRYWWERCIRGRLLTWLALLCVAAVSVPVIATQRPRPSYLFGLGVLLMALTGFWVQVLLRRLRLAGRASALMPAAMAGLCLLVPSYYLSAARRWQPRPLRQVIERLSPYRELLPGTNCL